MIEHPHLPPEVDIVALVSERVDLKPAINGLLKGRCPFHDERTPSFYVYPRRNQWRCFTCQDGSDATSFVMRRDGVDHEQAVQTLWRWQSLPQEEN